MNLAAMRTYRPDDVVDAVIVGTGAGGAPLLAQLAAAGLKVVALEAGPNFTPERFAFDETLADEPEYSPTLDASEDRFVPPPPPPLPRPQGLRGAAWVAVLGSPIVLLVCTLVSIDLPTPVAYALVAAFLGGFTHLLLTMPQGPRDPFDDGAQV